MKSFIEIDRVVLAFQRKQTDTQTDTQTDNLVFSNPNDHNAFSRRNTDHKDER